MADESDGTAEPTGRALQREQTRRRVYEAALEAFRRDGVASARIEDITQRAGVSRGTFYFHFPTKDDVLADLLRESQERICERLAGLPDGAPVGDALRLVAQEMAAHWRADPQLLPEVGMVALRRTATVLADTSRLHPAVGALVPRFREAAARGEIAPTLPPEVLAQFFLVSLFVGALAWCAEPSTPLELGLEGVVTFFARAMRP